MLDSSETSSAGSDLFAEIATSLPMANRAGLEIPGQTKVGDRLLPLGAPSACGASRKRANRLTTAEELASELERERTRMAPFMIDLSPKLPDLRSRFEFKETDWRIETDSDRMDFASVLGGSGGWERVSIPHYGPPLGKATTLYRVTFELPLEIMRREVIMLCFEGVDYWCMPYLNGVCLGRHEGFFEPFEFDISKLVSPGVNTLLVRVENDYTMLGEAFEEAQRDGDKIYAATGLGYDDPELGWHHCPAGMGISQPFRVEGRSRLVITDLHARPSLGLDEVEIHVEISNHGRNHEEKVGLLISVFGQNFDEVVEEGRCFWPTTIPEGGFGDLDKEMPDSVPLLLGPGKNYFRIKVPMLSPRIWDLETPWLYQVQVRLIGDDDVLLDAVRQQFGMRSFVQDEDSDPKGRFLLNGRQIRLRGANTMGNLDQSVFRSDFAQLRDDILLARVTRMNFLRLTQRPVQKAVYEYCDRLGMMLQVDLPLFGTIRRNQFLECVRQAAAMERLVRAHPSCIVVSFINEPFPNGRSRPHRFIDRADMQLFFDMASRAVRRENPHRVIKCVDGDYDPPVERGMPDNHCYCGWYIGHGVDLGQLHAGHWMPVKSGWYFGCGEFGSEGLDSLRVMDEHYPRDWLPEQLEDAWNPGAIPLSQTMKFHGLWYSTPRTLAEWIESSQAHQEWVTRLITEAFRRMERMNTFAIHLFIDAWPAGWMKTIMDVARVPKRAWFAYRDALCPTAVSLRTDRTAGFGGESVPVEVWVSNDLDIPLEGWRLDYEVVFEGRTLGRGDIGVEVGPCVPAGQGTIRVSLPEVAKRGSVEVGASLLDRDGKVLHDSCLTIDVFPLVRISSPRRRVAVLGDASLVEGFLEALGCEIENGDLGAAESILILDIAAYRNSREIIDRAVGAGATALFLSLPLGQHEIGSSHLKVRKAGMGPRHFVAKVDGHPLVAEFRQNDFRFWFSEIHGHVSPLLDTVLEGEGWTPLLQSSDGGWGRPWGPTPAAVERPEGSGCWRVCQVALLNRVRANPVANLFVRRLMEPFAVGCPVEASVANSTEG